VPLCFAGAAKTTSLADYIDLANQSGLNILYSSDLLRRRFQVTYDEDMAPTLESLRKALLAFDLNIEEIRPNTYTIVRLKIQNDLAQPKPVTPPEFTAQPIEEVIVSASRYRLYANVGGASQRFDAETLSERALTANDAARIVNQLPGSASVGVSARPRVRGGNEDETLILFDGVRLYNPFHFNRYNSLFSTFDSRVLGAIDFYSGGFPVSLGDRLSAAMLITTRQNDELANTRELGAGLFNLSYLQSIKLDDQSLLINIRRSNFELIDRLAENDLGKPSFGDVFVRYSKELDSGAVWDVNLLWFGDDIEINNSSNTEFAESHYTNTYLWSKLSQDVSDSLSRTTILGATQILDDREGQLNKPNQVVGDIKDDQTFQFYFVNQTYEYVSDAGLFAFGWDYRYIESDYVYQSEQVVSAAFANLNNIPRSRFEATAISETGHQADLYLNWKQRLNDTVTIETGIRLDVQHYERSIQDEQLNYRVGFLYEPNESLNLRLGWGRYSQSQGLHELNISDLEDEFQPVQQADHLIVGLDYAFSNSGVNLRLEAYHKDADKTRSYFQNLANPYTLIPELQVDRIRVGPERYIAKGIELSLDGSLLGGEWRLNYSYSSVKDELPGPNIRRSWDQTQAANIGYHREIYGWQISTSIAFNEGWLTTPLSFDGLVVTAGKRNSDRFDYFISADVKVMRSWKFSRGDLRVEAGLTNLFDRENQIGVDFELDNGALATTPEYGLPLAPFFDLYWAF
jgi:hypothetical protein